MMELAGIIIQWPPMIDGVLHMEEGCVASPQSIATLLRLVETRFGHATGRNVQYILHVNLKMNGVWGSPVDESPSSMNATSMGGLVAETFPPDPRAQARSRPQILLSALSERAHYHSTAFSTCPDFQHYFNKLAYPA